MEILVRINRTEQVEISVAVFKKLLDIPYIKDYRKYTLTLESLKISFTDLQKLARKANVPYPLFFAPEEIVDFQLQYKNRNISNKIQTKEIIQLNSRGNTLIKDVELLVKDIAKKQEFLKKRIFKKHPDNQFVELSNRFKNSPTEEVAEYIRNYFGFNLNILRDASKGKA